MESKPKSKWVKRNADDLTQILASYSEIQTKLSASKTCKPLLMQLMSSIPVVAERVRIENCNANTWTCVPS